MSGLYDSEDYRSEELYGAMDRQEEKYWRRFKHENPDEYESDDDDDRPFDADEWDEEDDEWDY